jgi:signal transduction histidine kinase
VETAAFRIVQEALTNVARHAGAPTVKVRVWRNGASLAVQVADAGKGFDVAAALAAGQSSGLSGMRERAAALGGKLDIESSSAGGTRLTAELPLPAAPAAAKMVAST